MSESGVEKDKRLSKETVSAINELMTDFRYNFEGPRDIDSVEQWVDEWIDFKGEVV